MAEEPPWNGQWKVLHRECVCVCVGGVGVGGGGGGGGVGAAELKSILRGYNRRPYFCRGLDP